MKFISSISHRLTSCLACLLILAVCQTAMADEKEPVRKKGPDKNLQLTLKPGLFKSITNPPCSYCVVQHRKGFIKQNDRAIA